MWDLDDLKSVNDHFGHSIGDRYIQEAAKIFDSVTNPKSAFCARLSGDEFVTFIYGDFSKEEYKKKILELSEKLKSITLTTQSGEKIFITASAGITYFPDNGSTCKELVRRADYAMYHVKASTKNAVYEFTGSEKELEYGSDLKVIKREE